MIRACLLCIVALLACEVTTVDKAPPSTVASAPAAPASSPGSSLPAPAAAPQPEQPPPAAEAEPSDPNAADDAEAPAFPEPTVVRASAPGVTLLEPGAEPRRALVLSPDVGARRQVRLSMQMQVAMAIGTQHVPPTAIPEIEVVMDTEVQRVGDRIEYGFAVAGARRLGAQGGSTRVAAAVDEAIASLSHAKGRITLTPQGRTEAVDLEIDDLSARGMKPAIQGFRQAFSQLFPVFAEQAVGVGARWTSVTHFEADALRIEQTATYTLQSLDGTNVALAVEFRQAATSTEDRNLGGATVDVSSFAAEGEGTIAIELDAVVPKSGRARSRSSSLSKLDMGGGGQELALDTVLDLSIAHTAPPG